MGHALQRQPLKLPLQVGPGARRQARGARGPGHLDWLRRGRRRRRRRRRQDRRAPQVLQVLQVLVQLLGLRLRTVENRRCPLSRLCTYLMQPEPPPLSSLMKERRRPTNVCTGICVSACAPSVGRGKATRRSEWQPPERVRALLHFPKVRAARQVCWRGGVGPPPGTAFSQAFSHVSQAFSRGLCAGAGPTYQSVSLSGTQSRSLMWLVSRRAGACARAARRAVPVASPGSLAGAASLKPGARAASWSTGQGAASLGRGAGAAS
jgi:hypothetical protein